tara:strand:- start:1787 stop:2275 length:489 start_codon:yes stop_codon:yes gene_type:complete
MSNEIIDKALGIDQIDPDKRVWEYDDDGTKIYKVDQGYPTKTPYEMSSQEITLPSQENRNNTNNDHVESDYEYQRQNFYNLVERGTDAVEGILELAKESDHPRAYEVAGNLIKQVAEVTEKLGDLQEKMRKLKEVPNNAPKNVTNALFVGSTAELQKMLKEK